MIPKKVKLRLQKLDININIEIHLFGGNCSSGGRASRLVIGSFPSCMSTCPRHWTINCSRWAVSALQCECEWVNVASIVKGFDWSVDWKVLLQECKTIYTHSLVHLYRRALGGAASYSYNLYSDQFRVKCVNYSVLCVWLKSCQVKIAYRSTLASYFCRSYLCFNSFAHLWRLSL